MEHQTYIDKNAFRKTDFERFVIVSNIDGELASFAIMAIKSNMSYKVVFKRTMPTKDITQLYTVINDCLAQAYHEYGIEIGRAVIAAAGPVSRKRGYIKLTNIDLTVNAQEILNHSLLHKVILLNDFEAIGYGLDMLDMSKDLTLIEHVGEDFTTPQDLSNTFAAIGASNGLGVSMAYLDKTKHIHVPMPSEGGHIDFAPQNTTEFELAQYIRERVMQRKNANPELERVLSKDGILHIYDFLHSKNPSEHTEATRIIEKLVGDAKLDAIIKNLKDPTCRKTVELFLTFYARAARNLALMSECYSGLFITGEIALMHSELFYTGFFMKEFEMHDQRTDVLRKVPVYMIKNKDVGLYGCCNVAVNFYNLM